MERNKILKIEPRKSFFKFLAEELKPKGRLLTPFNMITAPIILLGLILIVIRFALGLGAVTNLSQDFPWGIWIGFDVITGVAFAGGAFVVTFMVYITGMNKYHGIVRATVLNSLLAYIFYAGALLIDLGRPWNIINPIIGKSFGVSSVMFMVAWHFLLYTLVMAVEFMPAVAEWLSLKKLRKILSSLTLATVIMGIVISMGHQSGLGALFLIAKDKIHPLWYSEYLPVLFFVSSIYAGLSIVILENTLSHKFFKHRIDFQHQQQHKDIVIGLARAAVIMLFAYLSLKILTLIQTGQMALLVSKMGLLYLTEVLGFVFLPMVLFAYGAHKQSIKLILTTAIISIVGIALNRLNVSIIAFNWTASSHYFPSWMEIVVTLAVIFAEMWAFRWIVNRMPVLSQRQERFTPSAKKIAA